jgi:hypothetical protein
MKIIESFSFSFQAIEQLTYKAARSFDENLPENKCVLLSVWLNPGWDNEGRIKKRFIPGGPVASY